jgi:hypothetical protein
VTTSTNPLAAFQQFVAQQKDPYGLDRIRAGLASKGMKEWSDPAVKAYTEYQKSLGDVGGTIGEDVLKQYKEELAKGVTKRLDTNVEGGPGEEFDVTPEDRLAQLGFTKNKQGQIVYNPAVAGKKYGDYYAKNEGFDIGNKGVMLDPTVTFDPQTGKIVAAGPSVYQRENQGKKALAQLAPIATLATLPFGGIGSLLGGVTSSLTAAGLPSILSQALVSGVTQGGISKLMGGDFSKGFKSGAVSGGIGAGMNALAPDLFKGLGSLATPAKSLATQALTSAALGRKFDPAAAIKGAAINYGLGQGLQTAGVDPKAFNTFMQFAAPMIAARRRPGGG